ncbi:MAG: tail fiber domain-containing protein [Acidobacteriota bacterium]
MPRFRWRHLATRLLLLTAALTLPTLPALPVRAGFSGTEAFVPVVRAGGANGIVFSTTLWVQNPGTETATVQLRLLEHDRANPQPRATTLTLTPGETRRVDDAVPSLFGIESYGWMQILSSSDVLVNARIDGRSAGQEIRDSSGLFLSATPASFAVGAGESTLLPAIEQGASAGDGAFRYNVGFVETSGSPARIHLVLRNAQGAAAGTTDLDLAAFESRQINVGDVAPGVAVSAGSLEIQVVPGSVGRVLSFGSSIANGSNDAAGVEMLFASSRLASAAGSASGIAGVVGGRGLTGGGTSGTVTLHVGAGDGIAVTEDAVGLADAGVTEAKLAPSAVSSSRISNAGAAPGQVLTATVLGVQWATPATGGAGGGTGTVTSVGLSLPGTFSVAGSPVKTSGILSATWAPQSPNRLFAGPASGANLAPDFRTLVAADIPNLDAAKITTGSIAPARIPSLPASQISTGTLAVARGGTGTGAAFTQGGVLFSGASGVYSQSPSSFFWDAANGRLGIGTSNPTVPLHLAGSGPNIRDVSLVGPGSRPITADANGNLVIVPSDARLKIGVVPVSAEHDVRADLARLRGVFFRWDTSLLRAKDLGERRELGFLAQQVEAVLPEVVSTGPDGYRTLDYARLTAFLLEVAKAQDAEIARQKDTLEEQRALLDALARRLRALESAPRSR